RLTRRWAVGPPGPQQGDRTGLDGAGTMRAWAGTARRRSPGKDPMRRAAALCCVATVGLTVAACGGGSSGGSASGATSRANTSAYCNAARQVKQAGDALAANPDGLSNAFATFDKLASVAPGQIAPSVQTLRGFYGRVLTT